jgi:4-amino-4-deoxy-L-arabinose transferase-like glycosyltransferase
MTSFAERWLRSRPRLSDALVVTGIGAAARALVVWWTAGRFPPAEDGRFYHVVAGRIASGQGYTWLWPDAAVTYAAHYPIGYPAALGAVYALVGKHPLAAMSFNALLGTAAVFAVHRLVASSGPRLAALAAALLVALHPGLLMYTPALMTEGVVAALLALAAWLVVCARGAVGSSRWWWLCGLGVLFGMVILTRPQAALLAPVFGALAVMREHSGAGASARPFTERKLVAAALVTAIAVGICIPWTVRNCARMDRCVFVSANAGWNLLIGSMQEGHGAWVPIEGERVPPACRHVHGEADKDRCFGRAARERIQHRPLEWLALTPHKLGATFNYSGSAAFYLHSSNPRQFGDRAKLTLGLFESAADRLLLALALLALTLALGPRRRARALIGAVSLPWLLLPWAWISWLGVVGSAALLGRRLGQELPAALAASVVALTALTHSVFFGAGRYSLVCAPLLAALAGTVFAAGLLTESRLRSILGSRVRGESSYGAD